MNLRTATYLALAQHPPEKAFEVIQAQLATLILQGQKVPKGFWGDLFVLEPTRVLALFPKKFRPDSSLWIKCLETARQKNYLPLQLLLDEFAYLLKLSEMPMHSLDTIIDLETKGHITLVLNKENLDAALSSEQIKWVAEKQTAALADIATANVVTILSNKTLINMVPAGILIKTARVGLTGNMRRVSNIEHHAYFSKVLPYIQAECQAEFDNLKPLMEHTDVNLWLTPDKSGQTDYEDSTQLIAAIKEIITFSPDDYFPWFDKLTRTSPKSACLTLHWRALSQLPQFFDRITPEMEAVAFLNSDTRRYLNTGYNDYEWKCIPEKGISKLKSPASPQFPKPVSYLEMVSAYLKDPTGITEAQIKRIIDCIPGFKCPNIISLSPMVKWEVLKCLTAKVPSSDQKTFKRSILEAGSYETLEEMFKTDLTDCIPSLSDTWLDFKIEGIVASHPINQHALLEKALQSRDDATYTKVSRLIHMPSLEVVAESIIRGDTKPAIEHLNDTDLSILERFSKLVNNRLALCVVTAELKGRQTRKSEHKR